ncbi:carbamoyltransferase HypF [Halodesulfovibrio marinisediminis]|uniref:Carbamoyltransferase n=1 Tax=Halodesulfovibrio marinisediminis DSM 17456 TaxID=1121457 RepID=A0A1N6EZZ0_9BACT|nr:carbamoyltransferase HypF [Halodesulfovibrio marinisediminis]SIN88584.1 hydrogenase maturation protein HypF [Halodesulfovibrio marinisediminis DSM 17456]
MTHLVRRKRYIITGQVQGVGFRPFVYRIALENKVTGTVSNTSDGVFIEVQGDEEALAGFAFDLVDKLPPLAEVTSKTEDELPAVDDETEFTILASEGKKGNRVLISADVATCDDCLRDMADPENRRYEYPFTNCTNCGPRYTITKSIPYDRAKTSMSCFPLCPDCKSEYEDPLDRRFHAQPNACDVCGPYVWLTKPDGTEQCRGTEAIVQTAEALANGHIAAVKGLGGFHLACMATGDQGQQAIETLRTRKNRWGKPLAVMAKDIETARAIADLTEEEEKLLVTKERPIVLCKQRSDAPIAKALNPGTQYIGVMLPYTPLHHILFKYFAQKISELPVLVMTSGNMSSEPIALGNREALKRLHVLADVFLLHNRDILVRVDDSVVRVQKGTGKPQFFRRARGFTPRPVFMENKAPSVLGVGPELKNTLCYTRDNEAFVSQHIGDMQNLEVYSFYEEIAEFLPQILEIEVEAVVHDLHPDYMTTRFARDYGQERNIPVLGLQHHAAHIYSVLAENKFSGTALGLALDGTGYGEDGTIWGGELLCVNNQSLKHKRLGRLAHIPLPGGETAIHEPWRIAQGILWNAGINQSEKEWTWNKQFSQQSKFLPQLLERNINTPITSSCGRLFDAVSAMLGICHTVTYEGEAAILLEDAQDLSITEGYNCPLNTSGELLELDSINLFQQCYEDWQRGVAIGIIARKFHLGLIHGCAQLVAHAAKDTDINTIALSGGVMQSFTVGTELPKALAELGFTVIQHTQLPPNDGCISLGQAAYGRQWLLNQS